jgi:hypothetical protein
MYTYYYYLYINVTPTAHNGVPFTVLTDPPALSVTYITYSSYIDGTLPELLYRMFL